MSADPQIHWEFSVVIPFFQQERGILSKAVACALAQEGIATPRVIVVDDGSPISADSELQDLFELHPQHLVILRQDNAGPGAARNAGIAHARECSKYIALLDSDDTWSPLHLATAKRALDRAFDFYFCDAMHREGERTIFETRPIPQSECKPIAGERDLFEFTGDLFARFLRGRPMQTSSAVYRAEAVSVRFRPDLRRAQDHFFFLQLASSGLPTAFSTARNVQLGYGMNIYNSAEWGTPEVLLRIFYDQLCMKGVARQWSGMPRYRATIEQGIRRYRRDFVHNAISACRSNRRSEVLPIAKRYFTLDPVAALMLPLAVVGRVVRRI